MAGPGCHDLGEEWDKRCLGLRGPSVNSGLQASPFCLPQSVLKKRDQVQAEYEAKLEAVALRREDRPKVSEASGGWRGCSGRKL